MAVEGNMSSCDEEEDAVVEIGIVVAAVADGERRRAADDGEGEGDGGITFEKFLTLVSEEDDDAAIAVLVFLLSFDIDSSPLLLSSPPKSNFTRVPLLLPFPAASSPGGRFRHDFSCTGCCSNCTCVTLLAGGSLSITKSFDCGCEPPRAELSSLDTLAPLVSAASASRRAHFTSVLPNRFKTRVAEWSRGPKRANFALSSGIDGRAPFGGNFMISMVGSGTLGECSILLLTSGLDSLVGIEDDILVTISLLSLFGTSEALWGAFFSAANCFKSFIFFFFLAESSSCLFDGLRFRPPLVGSSGLTEGFGGIFTGAASLIRSAGTPSEAGAMAAFSTSSEALASPECVETELTPSFTAPELEAVDALRSGTATASFLRSESKPLLLITDNISRAVTNWEQRPNQRRSFLIYKRSEKRDNSGEIFWEMRENAGNR
nr:hypothetical protein Iba_chr10fCG3410 [Ipomoea batatas]